MKLPIPLIILFLTTSCLGETDRLILKGASGPGKGKHIVLIAGDEEYRSEEALPMLARILARRHGFTCTVLFALNSQDGTIDPNSQTNIPGLRELNRADLMILFTRFRELPDSEMKYFVNYIDSGKPILGIRTATHAFAYERNKQSQFAHYDWRSKEWPGGFGQQVLGETWVRHHGIHGKESTRGVIDSAMKTHPVLEGVEGIWGPTDVYEVIHLPSDAKVLVWGQVLQGMKPDDAPVEGPKNHPMMPLIWTREYKGTSGRNSRVLCTTIGSAVDLQSEGLRRLLVNACYWALRLENQVPPQSDVRYVGAYEPTFFGFNGFKKGTRPADYLLK